MMHNINSPFYNNILFYILLGFLLLILQFGDNLVMGIIEFVFFVSFFSVFGLNRGNGLKEFTRDVLGSIFFITSIFFFVILFVVDIKVANNNSLYRYVYHNQSIWLEYTIFLFLISIPTLFTLINKIFYKLSNKIKLSILTFLYLLIMSLFIIGALIIIKVSPNFGHTESFLAFEFLYILTIGLEVFFIFSLSKIYKIYCSYDIKLSKFNTTLILLLLWFILLFVYYFFSPFWIKTNRYILSILASFLIVIFSFGILLFMKHKNNNKVSIRIN